MTPNINTLILLTLFCTLTALTGLNLAYIAGVWNSLDAAVLSASAIIFSLAIIQMRKPTDSLLCLIAAFISIIMILIEYGMEFVGFSFLIVYIGAIAILFLFVIILFNLVEIFTEKQTSFVARVAFISAIYYVINFIKESFYVANTSLDVARIDKLFGGADVYLVADVLYSTYIEIFAICGWSLLVAMIGAMAATLSY